MQIFSNPEKDVSTPKPLPGSYEWWYFDAISNDGQYSLVVIFYEGNPFSRRYIDAIDSNSSSKADQFPAISISVYKGGQPIFYSFEEVHPYEGEFSDEVPKGRIKRNTFEQASPEDGSHSYLISLAQMLPTGDTINGEITFRSIGNGPFDSDSDEKEDDEQSKHQWNLIQPAANVTGKINITGLRDEAIEFEGKGYHDHNMGMEPMKESFKDWYWGRFHFSDFTLIYYLMNKESGRNDCAWIIDSGNNVTMLNGEFDLSDMALNVFGLKSARKIELKSKTDGFLIQQQHPLDDGPFYQRFSSRIMLTIDDELHQAQGISEYISPERIYMKLFRPLVNMRIQYPEKAHWVQKSPRLYRWTW